MGSRFSHWYGRVFGPRVPLTLFAETKPSRLLPLDALRGFIIVVMALDHANSLIAHGKLEPELWANQFPNYRGDALTFLTRFGTHLAAPGFFFLLGVGMVLFAMSRRQQGWSKGQIMRHFVVRGTLLILFQFFVENPAWETTPTGYIGVLYALGWAMLIGSLLLHLSARWLTGLSVLLVVLTELLLPDAGSGFVEYALALRLWLLPGHTQETLVLYPVMPWLGRPAAFHPRPLAWWFWEHPPNASGWLDRLSQCGQVSAEHRLSIVDVRREFVAVEPVCAGGHVG